MTNPFVAGHWGAVARLGLLPRHQHVTNPFVAGHWGAAGESLRRTLPSFCDQPLRRGALGRRWLKRIWDILGTGVTNPFVAGHWGAATLAAQQRMEVGEVTNPFVAGHWGAVKRESYY